jgi:hypothetical protein
MKFFVKKLVGDSVVVSPGLTVENLSEEEIEYGKTKIFPNPWDGDIPEKKLLKNSFLQAGDCPWSYQMFIYLEGTDWILGRIRGSITKGETWWAAEVVKINRFGAVERVFIEAWFLFSFSAYQVIQKFCQDKPGVQFTDYYRQFTEGYQEVTFMDLEPGTPFSLLNNDIQFHNGVEKERYAFCPLRLAKDDENGSKSTLVLLGNYSGDKGQWNPSYVRGLNNMERFGYSKKSIDQKADRLYLYSMESKEIGTISINTDFDEKNVRYSFEWLTQLGVRGITIAQDDRSLKLLISEDSRRKLWMVEEIIIRKTDFYDVQEMFRSIIRGRYGCLYSNTPMFDSDIPKIKPVEDRILLVSYMGKKKELNYYLVNEKSMYYLEVVWGSKIRRGGGFLFAYQVYQEIIKILEEVPAGTVVTKTDDWNRFLERLV